MEPPTKQESAAARRMIEHVHENREWYTGRLVEPYRTMAEAKIAAALRESRRVIAGD